MSFLELYDPEWRDGQTVKEMLPSILFIGCLIYKYMTWIGATGHSKSLLLLALLSIFLTCPEVRFPKKSIKTIIMKGVKIYAFICIYFHWHSLLLVGQESHKDFVYMFEIGMAYKALIEMDGAMKRLDRERNDEN